MSDFHKKKIQFRVVVKFEDLISLGVLSTDVVIIDRTTNTEFLVRNSMALLDHIPRIIWLDEQAKVSSKQIHLKIKSIFH